MKLNRRSTNWSMKLEKFQSEESRLREIVRELAEQNVCLQREISSLKDSEQSIRCWTMSSEIQMQDLSSNLEEARVENHNLHQELSELHERFKIAEENLSSIRNNYRLKEKENKELQKVVVRLQKTCNEQDKSINGLRQAFSDELGKISIDSLVSRLQMEQVRLTGVEQTLRKEIESCRCEVESLRHENMHLLNRLQSNKHEKGFYFSVKLEEELRDRMECLQNQVNYKECLMKRIQKMTLDYHFKVEQEAGSATHDFFGFNGTTGVWRVSTINEFEGWNDRTTFKDMDLAVRAGLNGWKFVYVHDLKVNSFSAQRSYPHLKSLNHSLDSISLKLMLRLYC